MPDYFSIAVQLARNAYLAQLKAQQTDRPTRIEPANEPAISTMTYDGETACLTCGVIICAYCQGQESACPGAHQSH